jgi:hypothetical protein
MLYTQVVYIVEYLHVFSLVLKLPFIICDCLRSIVVMQVVTLFQDYSSYTPSHFDSGCATIVAFFTLSFA